MAAGNLINALLALTGLAAFTTLFGVAMIRFGLWITDAGKVRADAGNDRAGSRTVGRQLSVVGSQTSNQNNSLQNPGSIDRTAAK